MDKRLTLLDRLEAGETLTREDFLTLLRGRDAAFAETLFARAGRVRRREYGNAVYIRGLIEFTSYCRQNCLYCGLRRDNRAARRYRLTADEILACCENGWDLGFRTFVLQGGEDPYFTAPRLAEIVSRIRARFPDCAITLSVGERPDEDYALWRAAGADRYLLRHETANFDHYRRLHPPEMDPANRRRCLSTLRRLGYQVGAGFMVGSPGQTDEHLAEDLLFLADFQPEMVGIGPFLPQKDTPFGDKPAGGLALTLYLLALIRLLLPGVLLPATTALATLDPQGRVRGMQAGANVCMPNLSPDRVRGQYAIYDNKLCTGGESASGEGALVRELAAAGFEVVSARGDCKTYLDRERRTPQDV